MKENNLGKDNINKLLITFAIPCVISMLVNSIYNIVDQIFIGKGVGTLGNAATNVIFPLVIIFTAVASLIGNGMSAFLSLKLGEKKYDEAKKSLGSAIVFIFLVAIILSVVSYLALPKLVYLFGCTENVYKYALDYGKIIILGAPFMMVYTALSNIIRADNSPKYSMIMLLIGAIINIILDPIFIFVFNQGVKGGAFATIIGQIVSFIIAVAYIKKIKSVKLEKKDFKINKSIWKVLSLGASTCITQMTVLVLFVFMNNILTKYGALSKFGADIPLSVYGIVSKVNSIYISCVIGISIGAQPIVGFNYGAGNYKRVKETIKKVLIINFVIGVILNILLVVFPEQIIGIFISKSDSTYDLFMEFAVLICRSFLIICSINAFEMTASVMIQSLGNVIKATCLSFLRQILLFIPISLLLAITFNKGIYGVLQAGPIADAITFIVCLIVLKSEMKKLSKVEDIKEEVEFKSNKYKGKHIVITISREYASGGRYVGQILAKNLGINFYDKDIISLTAKESGLSSQYITEQEQTKKNKYENNNDDRLFIAECNVIKKLANESCVIVGRCADYVLKDNKDVIKVFLYSDDENKIKRAVKYYGLDKKNALKRIKAIDKERAKHYKYYTSQEWKDFSNYDIVINVDKFGVEKTAKQIEFSIKND